MAAPDGRSAAHERGRAADVTGVVVLSACAVWSLISAAGRDARPEGVLLAVFAVAAGYACGRICGTLLPVAAASAAALAALALAVASRQGVPGATPGGDTPPGHTGAAAALLILAVGAACCAAAAARAPLLRLGLRLFALAVVCVALPLGTPAGFAAALGVLLCSLAAVRMRRRTIGLAGLALATALAVAGSWGVAEDALPPGLTVAVEGQLTQNRVALWRDALALAKDDPIRGAGPERFAKLSPTAQQSLGSDGQPHSATLQQAAEQGGVGVTLLGAAFGWLLYGLWRSPRSTPVVLSAGAALTGLAVLANVGNALSFAPVTAGVGLLAGLATARLPGGSFHGEGRPAEDHSTGEAGATARIRTP
ncbi:O-antigen ligase family protein [Streptomyces sp. NPDC051907]|uniref:O-antigen ligase family protein n=1 Tax=Streptomyces sp. NPDC051907 TaxID=3155284 RepID=UPI003417692A